MPAISSARRRGSFLARLRRFGTGSPPERSILGARFRTRCPQYGHSVTYGLTSAPQFLQTTNRSGCDTVSLRVPGAQGPPGRLFPGGLRALGHGGVQYLADDLAEVVVRLVDDLL